MLNLTDDQRVLLDRLKTYSWVLWITITAIAGWVLWDRLHDVDAASIAHRVLSTPPTVLIIAVLCCLGVNLLAGIYEGVAVRSVTGRKAWLHAGIVASVANPIGHMVGNALLGASALRYRMHGAAGLTGIQISGVIALTAMPFLLGVGWLIDLALIFFADEAGKALHVAVPTLVALGAIGLAKDAGWIWFVRNRTAPLQIAGFNIRIPTLSATLVQILIGMGEILLAAAVLYVLLPATVGISFLTFVAIYLLAAIIGQLSHVPAGLGVFEAALLVMMPQVTPEQLLGAVLLYRAVYDLLPLAVALTLLLAHEMLVRQGRLQHVVVTTTRLPGMPKDGTDL